MHDISGEIVSRVFFGNEFASIKFGEETISEALSRCVNIKIFHDPAFLIFGDSAIEKGWFPHLNKKK